MDSVFITKLALSFLVAGIWAILVTTLADKFGSKIGGLIAGLPSTLLFGMFFLGWSQTPAAAVAATQVVPAAGIMSNLFLLFYVILLKFSLSLALGASFLLWGILAAVVVTVSIGSYSLTFLVYLLSVGLIYWLMDRGLKIRSAQGNKIRYTPKLLTVRGIISGSITAIAVFLAKIGGPVLGGVFSMFPAMFSSTLIITYFSQGAVFSKAIAKTILVSGVSVVVYSLGVRNTYLNFGLIMGTFLSLLLSLVTGYLIYQLILRKLS